MILKNPSWQGLNPGLPEYKALDSNLALELQQQTGIVGRVSQAYFAGIAAEFYRIETKQEKFFVKLIKEEHRDHHYEAENLAKWLKTKQIKVNALVKEATQGYYVYPLLEGKRLDSSTKDLRQLGSALALFQQTLKDYPAGETIKQRTSARLSRLQDIREEVAKGRLMVSPFPQFFRELAENWELDFTAGDSVQFLHGDLNPGNLLQVEDEIYFFDFEDSLHSHLPVIYELVYVLERMIFTRQRKMDGILECGYEFMHAYLEQGGNYHFREQDQYAELALVLRSLCVLTLCELSGNKIVENEWRKFFNLAHLAVENQTILKKILKV